MHISEDLRKYIANSQAGMENDFTSYRASRWQIQQNILPFHGRGLGGNGSSSTGFGGQGIGASSSTEDTNGNEKIQLYDTTAIRALGTLAAGIQGGFASEQREWFKLGTHDPALNNSKPVRIYLDEVANRMRSVFARSGFYKSSHHTVKEAAGFGTGCMMALEDFDTAILFRPLTYGEYLLSTDHRGKVNTFSRKFWMRSGQMVDQFGRDHVSQAVRNSVDSGNTSNKREILHIIEPNNDKFDDPRFMGRPFREIYMEWKGDSDAALSMSGYHEFPVIAPRWFIVGNEVYGRGQGDEVLPATQELQKLKESLLEGIDKTLRPPLVSNGDNNDLVINSFPDGITYTNSQANVGTGGRLIEPLYAVNFDLNGVRAEIDDARNEVGQGMFTDLFRMLSSSSGSPQKTAREVAELHEEKLMLLGPIAHSLNTELFNPTIDRTFGVMERAGLLPEPPEELEGVELKVEYISILAQAMKLAGVTNIEQFAGFVGSVASIRPQVVEKVDFDQMIDDYGDGLSIPPEIIIETKALEEQRAAEAQRQQLEQAGLALDTISTSAKTLSEAELNNGSALDMMLGRN